MNRYACLIVAFALVIFALSVASMPAQAAATGSISGTVVAVSSGGPIAGAKVDLIGPGGTVSTSSAKDGAFSFTGLGVGTYVVRVSAKLYQTAESSPLALADGQAISLQVAIQPVTTTNISTMGRVVVAGHATLNTSSASSFTVTNNQFLDRGATQIQTGLEALPGVTLERYDNGAPGAVTTFTIRGAGGFGSAPDGTGNTGYEILVLQDGEPLRNGQFGDFDASSLTPAIYSRVEVIKGVGGSSLFGANTIGGTVNLVTRDPAKTEGGEFILGYGGFGTSDWNVSETNTFGRFGYLIDLHRYHTDGFIPPSFVGLFGFGCCISHATQTMDLKSGLAKLRYDFSNSAYLVLDTTLESDYRDQVGLLGNPNLDSNGNPIIGSTTGLPSFFGFPGDYVWNIQPKYAADFHTALGGGTLILRAYSQYLERVVDGLNEPGALCCFETRSLDHLTGQLISWTKGFGGHTVTLAVGGNGDNFYFGNNPTFACCVTFAQLSPTAQGIQLERTYLLRDDFTASPRLDLTFAGYYSTYDTLQVKRFDPRLAAVFKPDSESVIRASVGTGFAAPRLSDLYSPIDLISTDAFNGPTCSFCVAAEGNPNLKAETAFGADIGYQRLFPNDGNLSIDLYRTNLTNHIFSGVFPAPAGLMFTGRFPGPVTYVSKPVNLAGTVYTGVEFEGRAPVSQNFGVRASYNIQAAYPTGVDPFTAMMMGDVVNNQQYLGVPIHKYGWTVDYRNLAHTSTFFGADYYGQNNGYNQPPFWLYNAGANVPVGENTLHVIWTNIFNKNAGLWSAFNFGVPYPAAPGYSGCNGTDFFCTSGFNAPPHNLTVTFDHRWGSLR